jgi:nucleotide-binding universal stress UspA family protein
MATLIETESAATTVVALGPIVIGTDGEDHSLGALSVGRALAGALAARAQVVAVQPMMNFIVPDASLLIEPSALATLTADLATRVKTQCALVSAGDGGPKLDNARVEQGQPERVLSRIADELNAQLVIVGIGRHEITDRIFGSETAVKLAQLSHSPVLAVPERCKNIPRVAVMATDFSEESFDAAFVLARLMPEGAALHLVHVAPRERMMLDPWLSDSEYRRIVRHRFERLRARMKLPPGVSIVEIIRSGDIAGQLIRYATEVNADLIAAGSQGHGFVARVLLGSVSRSLLRGAQCMVLVVPPNRAMAGGGESGYTTHAEPSRWSALLDDVSRANAGRRVRLEVDDPEFGAQAQENDYPLGGIAYDPHDESVEIMLGVARRGASHLSRSIGNVTSIDVLTDKEGHDRAVRLRHGEGQTLLSFTG